MLVDFGKNNKRPERRATASAAVFGVADPASGIPVPGVEL